MPTPRPEWKAALVSSQRPSGQFNGLVDEVEGKEVRGRKYITLSPMGGRGSLQVITVLHRGGSSQMITVLHRGGPANGYGITKGWSG